MYAYMFVYVRLCVYHLSHSSGDSKYYLDLFSRLSGHQLNEVWVEGVSSRGEYCAHRVFVRWLLKQYFHP